MANNATYITLSNQIAQNRQLEVVANNVANANSPGYQQEALLMKKATLGKNKQPNFVIAETNYKTGNPGPIKATNRPTDLVINELDYYFKVMTPNGPRYTLDGSASISAENILVNDLGYPYLSSEGGEIAITEQFQDIVITSDGTVFVDSEEVGKIGVFGFIEKHSLINEGNRLYSSTADDIVMEDYKIISGALRMSNVNSAESMAKMVEVQRSTGATNNLMSNVYNLEKSAITKLMK